MEACYGGTGVMERPCAVARGKDINIPSRASALKLPARAKYLDLYVPLGFPWLLVKASGLMQLTAVCINHKLAT